LSFLDQVEKLRSERGTSLCVGLDPDLDRLPEHVPRSPEGVYRFLAEIIEATGDLACAYKPNLAFYGALGIEGFSILGRVIRLAKEEAPVILDGKFGDIGNTARSYAEMAFDTLLSDAVTLSPYLGADSIVPFIDRRDAFAFILGITSNDGSADVQQKKLDDGNLLFESLAQRFEERFPQENWGWVAGATKLGELEALREKSPDRLLLIPGVGAQGGDLAGAITASLSSSGKPMALINASRSILYASSGRDYKETSRDAAMALVREMRAATL